MKSDSNKTEKHVISELVTYKLNSVVCKTILQKPTGSIVVSSFEQGESLPEKTLAFDTYIQVLDGTAEIQVNKMDCSMHAGEGLIIPAHASQSFYAGKKFKMLATLIKSGYE